MARSFLAALAVCVLLGQAHAARDLRAPESFAARALKQVGDAFTRYGTIDDGSRSYGSAYHAISGSYEPGSYGQFGYYGSPTAASYFGSTYPSQAELALARMNPSSNVLQNRASVAMSRYRSYQPYDF
ncbi:hypothetical protein Rsub_12929 [Raphidocelis subcapitata]|uniref:Uncharacterized protein n=1 Tax=Raphidocelis subcapitata TaxID=307507 RepID=A0A2V0PK38_9CHLO|nr:hypothetical protein Rsub_12929 [Raphidocelis subcapitata]|eukprot:GBG00172.1 hypothetical protein Rsub_12929 [Raphidocelis subcapitata]